MKTKAVVFILFCLIAMNIQAQGLVEVESNLKSFKVEMYNQNLTQPQLTELFDKNVQLLKASNLSESDKNYYLSVYHFLRAKAYHHGALNYKQLVRITVLLSQEYYMDIQFKQEADFHYSTSIDYAAKSITLDANKSDAYRIKAESEGQLCLVRGFLYTMGHGLQVLKDIDTALKIDPENGKAILLEGQGKAYPPPIYFGSTKKAVKYLDACMRAGNMQNDDYFNALVAYAVCYSKEQNLEIASDYYRKALKIYPGNKFANEMFRLIQNNNYSPEYLKRKEFVTETN